MQRHLAARDTEGVAAAEAAAITQQRVVDGLAECRADGAAGDAAAQAAEDGAGHNAQWRCGCGDRGNQGGAELGARDGPRQCAGDATCRAGDGAYYGTNLLAHVARNGSP